MQVQQSTFTITVVYPSQYKASENSLIKEYCLGVAAQAAVYQFASPIDHNMDHCVIDLGKKPPFITYNASKEDKPEKEQGLLVQEVKDAVAVFFNRMREGWTLKIIDINQKTWEAAIRSGSTLIVAASHEKATQKEENKDA